MNLISAASRCKPMICIAFFFFIFIIYIQFLKPFGWDELEHIHSSYLVYSGEVPYRDFFQHHHPLMWYLYSVIFNLFSSPVTALWAIKIVSIIVGFINLYLVYLISGFYLKSQSFRFIALILSTTSIIFVSNQMEIRPDNLMCTFILISYLFLIRFIESNNFKNLIVAGLAIGISLLFLQKAIIFILIYNLILLIEKFPRKAKDFKDLVISIGILNIFLSIPIGIFLGVVIKAGFWQQYFFFNWTLNALFEDVFSITRTFREFTILNAGFFILLVLAFTYMAGKIKLVLFDKTLRTLFITSILYFLSLLTITRSPYSQYLISIIFFGSIIIAMAMEAKYVPNDIFRISLIVFAVFMSSFPIFIYKSLKINDYTFTKQLAEIEAVNNKSINEKEGLRIQEEMNLFFTGHKFYWFSPEGQRTIQHIQNDGKLPGKIKQVGS